MANVGMRSYRRPGRYGTGNQGSPDDMLTVGSGWTVFSYLIAGMLVYGGIGWVIGHFTHISLLFPIGMLVGLAISIGWIIYQYGRPHERGNSPEGR